MAFDVWGASLSVECLLRLHPAPGSLRKIEPDFRSVNAAVPGREALAASPFVPTPASGVFGSAPPDRRQFKELHRHSGPVRHLVAQRTR